MKRLQRFLVATWIVGASIAYADVAILKTAGVTAFDEARNGFLSTCFETNKQFDLAEDHSNQGEIINSIRGGNFNLIFAIGSHAATLARDSFPEIPIVFAFVVNPEKNGFKKENTTGVALSVPIREQFIVLKTISRKIKRIGLIYTKGLNEDLVAAAIAAGEEENLEIVSSPINSRLDLQKVMTEMVGKVEALWIPPDPSLNSDEAIKYIGSKSLENKIPCVGPSDRYVRSGAIFSYSADTLETGRIAGEMANKILQGTPTSKVPVQEIQKPKVIINLKAAALLGVSIPQNLQNAASKVYQ